MRAGAAEEGIMSTPSSGSFRRWIWTGIALCLVVAVVFVPAMLLLVRWLDPEGLQRANNLGGTFNILSCFTSALAMAAAFYAALMQHREFQNAERENAIEARLAAATAILSSYPAILESRVREVGSLLQKLQVNLSTDAINPYSLDSIREFKAALSRTQPRAEATATRIRAEDALLHTLQDKLGDMEDIVSALDLSKGAVLASFVRTLKQGEGV
jgi:hypothetical protein